jgi:hypothetical protein
VLGSVLCVVLCCVLISLPLSVSVLVLGPASAHCGCWSLVSLILRLRPPHHHGLLFHDDDSALVVAYPPPLHLVDSLTPASVPYCP